MAQMIRREAMTRLAGVGAVLGLTGGGAFASAPQPQAAPDAAILQGTLTPAHADGRRLVGFLETGVAGGQALCSLVRQDQRNPAVQAVFAAPAERDGRHGVEVSISFFTEPVGEVTFSLLHIGGGPAIGRVASPSRAHTT